MIRNFVSGIVVSALAVLLSVSALDAQGLGGSASISATATSANVALPVATTTWPSVVIAPATGTTTEVFYALGNSSVVATGSSYALPSGGICVNVGSATTIAAIAPGGTATVRITQISGCTQFAGAGGGGSGGGSVTQGTTPWVTSIQPSALAANGLTTTPTAALAATLAVSGTHNLFSYQVSADTTLSGAAWWLLIFDATAAPADGAVTPKKCYAMPSGSTLSSGAFVTPLSFTTGIAMAVSTTGCFTKTASVHSFISFDYK